AGAIAIYEGIVTQPAKTDEDRQVQELVHLALGRLHYERSEFAKAIDEYQKVQRTSPLFADMLYEVAWTFIKNAGKFGEWTIYAEKKGDLPLADANKKQALGEFQKAYRALDLLM